VAEGGLFSRLPEVGRWTAARNVFGSPCCREEEHRGSREGVPSGWAGDCSSGPNVLGSRKPSTYFAHKALGKRNFAP